MTRFFHIFLLVLGFSSPSWAQFKQATHVSADSLICREVGKNKKGVEVSLPLPLKAQQKQISVQVNYRGTPTSLVQDEQLTAALVKDKGRPNLTQLKAQDFHLHIVSGADKQIIGRLLDKRGRVQTTLHCDVDFSETRSASTKQTAEVPGRFF